jgi:PAS domain S-box-containing protein
MKASGLPHNEIERLRALRNLKLLDSGREARFDRITRIAQAYFQAPIVLISLVDEHSQWFKSFIGVDFVDTPRTISFCSHVIAKGSLVYIPDATLDPTFSDNPLVTHSPYVRFYVGIPIESPDGFHIGSLCVIDNRPRTLSPMHIDVLEDLASLVNTEIARSLELANRIHSISTEWKFQQLLEYSPWVVYGCKVFGRFDITYVNQQIQQQTGYSADDFITHENLWLDSIHPNDLEKVNDSFRTVIRYGENQVTYRIVDSQGNIKHVLDCQSLIENQEGDPFEVMGIRIELQDRSMKHLDFKIASQHKLSGA